MFGNIDYDGEKKIWSLPKNICVFNGNTSIGHAALFMMRSRSPDTVCQISDSEQTTITFGEASDYAVLIAEHLRSIGLTDEDVVGIAAPMTTFLMPVIVGCWLNCIPYHPINAELDDDTMEHIFNITRSKVIFCDGKYHTKLERVTRKYDAKIYTLRNAVEGVPTVEDILKTTKSPKAFQPTPLKKGGNQAVAIYCSSGTTGLPKCVPSSNERFLTDWRGAVYSNKVIYLTSGVHWITSALYFLFCPLYGSKCIISTVQQPSADYICKILKKYDVTFLCATPMQIAELTIMPSFAKDNLPHLKCFIMGGASNTTYTLTRLREKFSESDIYINYGSTEAGFVSYNSSTFKAGVLGKLCPGVQVSIIDPETKTPLGYKESGEICVRRDEPWLGYIGNESATREMLDNEGWVHTGDRGYMDEENILHFCDRYKDILKYHNFHYSPLVIERTIQELPEVLDVCVFGVYDERFGDLAAAAVVTVSESTLTEKDIVDHVSSRQELEQNRVHYGVFFVEKILRNANGKVMRKEMKDFCLNGAQCKK